MSRRAVHSRRSQLCAAEIDLPGISRIGQNPMNRGLIPALQATGRGQSQRLQMQAQAGQADAFAQVPG